MEFIRVSLHLLLRAFPLTYGNSCPACDLLRIFFCPTSRPTSRSYRAYLKHEEGHRKRGLCTPSIFRKFPPSIDPMTLNLLLQLNVTFPRNTIKVFAELYASGNGEEEFWVGPLPLSSFRSLNPH